MGVIVGRDESSELLSITYNNATWYVELCRNSRSGPIPRDWIVDAVRSVCTERCKTEDDIQELATKIVQRKTKNTQASRRIEARKKENPDASCALKNYVNTVGIIVFIRSALILSLLGVATDHATMSLDFLALNVSLRQWFLKLATKT
jgi:hypothetical protein